MEAYLDINESDMLPLDLIPLLVNNMPINRTSFGFVSTPVEGKGRYYTVLKQEANGLHLCTGEYVFDGKQCTCLDFDKMWIIRNGLIENYFYNQNWPDSPVEKWTHENFELENTLDYLSIQDLNFNFRDYIANNGLLEFFYTDNWSPEFYRKQAKLGFIAITLKRNGRLMLLPQLQSSYALLDWNNLKIDKKVGKILNGNRIEDENIRLNINSDPGVVLKNLFSIWGDTLWLKPQYEKLITDLASSNEQENDNTFRIWGVTLTAGKSSLPIAGELGYTIGKTYTSLTGYFNREKKEFNNFGKLQMVMLAKILEQKGIAFWNLGHPHMKYKIDLGARVVSRDKFLERWDVAVYEDSVDLSSD